MRQRVLIEASKLADERTDGVRRYVHELLVGLKLLLPHGMPDLQIDVMVMDRIYALHDLPDDFQEHPPDSALRKGQHAGAPEMSQLALGRRLVRVFVLMTPRILVYPMRWLLPELAFRKILGKSKKEISLPRLRKDPVQWAYLCLPPLLRPLTMRVLQSLLRPINRHVWTTHRSWLVARLQYLVLSMRERGVIPTPQWETDLNVYDLIHLTLPNNYSLIGSVESPLLVTVHDLSHIHCPQFQNRANTTTLSFGMERVTSRGAHFISPSDATRSQLMESYQVPSENVTTVRHGCRDDVFHAVNDDERLADVRSKYGIRSKRFLLTLGTIEPRKNLVAVIAAFQEVIENGVDPEILLVIAGPKGWHTDETLSRVGQMKGRVHCTGYIDEEDLAPLYSAAMAFVYASHYEGFGLPLLEAMQCGLPVIYGDNSSMPEVVGDAGLGVDSSDVHDIAEKMQRLLSEPDLRHEFSRQALARSAEFSWEQAATSTLRVYREVLGYRRH